MIEIQTERIKRLLLNEDHPPFMTYKSKVWNSNNILCNVLLVKAEPFNISLLNEYFENLEDNNSAHYISWEDWDSLSLKRQNTVINTQNKYHTKYASIILSGLYDKDKITMGHGIDLKEFTLEEHTLLSLTVTEFIETHLTMIVDNVVVPIA